MAIAFLSIITFLFLFFTIGFKQIFSENIITPVLNASLGAVGDQLTAGTISTLNSFQAKYDEPFFNYDLFFLVLMFGFATIAITSSYKSRKMGYRSFFGYITIGSWLFFLILGLINEVGSWLILNFYTNLFNTSLISTPIIDWFVSNMTFYSFLLFFICLLANQFDIADIVRGDSEGRAEE